MANIYKLKEVHGLKHLPGKLRGQHGVIRFQPLNYGPVGCTVLTWILSCESRVCMHQGQAQRLRN